MLDRLTFNALKNRIWVETGVEALWIAVYLEYTNYAFMYPRYDILNGVLRHLNDHYVPIIFAVVGCYCIVIAVFDITQMHAHLIATAASQFVFTWLLIAFINRDALMGMLSWTTGFLAVMSIRLYVEPIRSRIMVKLATRVAENKWDRK